MSDYFVPSTISAEAIAVFLLFIALTAAATWFAARYYLLKRNFDSAVQKINYEYALKIDEERRRIQRIPYQLQQIELLIEDIRKCCAGEPKVQTAENQDDVAEEN